MTTPTQVRRPWRAVARTVFQAVVGLAAMAPVIYNAVTTNDADQATGAFGAALAISAAVTRVMALPGVNGFIEKFLPFLAAEPKVPDLTAEPLRAVTPQEFDGYGPPVRPDDTPEVPSDYRAQP